MYLISQKRIKNHTISHFGYTSFLLKATVDLQSIANVYLLDKAPVKTQYFD